MNIKKNNFNYSLKNVPIPSKQQHIKATIIKAEEFIQRIRWKAYFFGKPKTKQTNTYGFKTLKNAPQCSDLTGFENDLNNLIANLKYSDKITPFQKRLSKDIKKINSSPNLFVKADKTNNIYEVDKKTYQKLLKDNVTSTYKIAEQDIENKINKKKQSNHKRIKN